MKQNAIINNVHLKCDNPKCDYVDEAVNSNNYAQYINKECPKCGDNLLTEEDYKTMELFMAAVHLTNARDISIDETDKTEYLVSTHQGLSIKPKL